MTVVKLHYFKGRGRAETTRWMLAANQIDFVNVPVTTAQELAALRESGKPPFGQMPVLEIDGLCLSQSSAMIRYLARKGGFYGSADIDALWCDMLAGVVADFAEVAMAAAFQPTLAHVEANIRAALGKFGPHFEKRLAVNGDWLAGSKLSFADVVMAEAMTHAVEWVPDLLAGSALAAHRERVCDQAGIAAYLASPQRWPRPDDHYVIDVAQVLLRALPPHFPHSHRFVTG